MRLEPSDEQRFLREAVRGVLEREATPARVRAWAYADEGSERIPTAPAEIALRQGWTGIGIPEARGGQGGGMMEVVILAEEIGRAALPADRLYAAVLAARLAGTLEHPAVAALAEANATGEAATVLAHGAGAPLDTPSGVCVVAGRAAGAAQLVLGAAAGEALLVAVPSGEGIDLVRVTPAEGAVRSRRLVDHTRELADVDLDGAPAESLGPLSRHALAVLAAEGAVLLAADALGAAQRMLELTTEYVGQREQFGVPVGSFQAVKHAAAEMLVDVEATRSAVLYAAWALDARAPDAEVSAWIAKAHASTAAGRVADKALFLHGAVGFTWEHDLQMLFKRAKSDALLLGSADRSRDRIADGLELVGAPA